MITPSPNGEKGVGKGNSLNHSRPKGLVGFKMSYLANAERYLVQTLVTAGETVRARRDLATNPCVTLDTALGIDNQMMAFAEQV